MHIQFLHRFNRFSFASFYNAVLFALGTICINNKINEASPDILRPLTLLSKVVNDTPVNLGV